MNDNSTDPTQYDEATYPLSGAMLLLGFFVAHLTVGLSLYLRPFIESVLPAWLLHPFGLSYADQFVASGLIGGFIAILMAGWGIEKYNERIEHLTQTADSDPA